MATFDGIVELCALCRGGKVQLEVGDRTPLLVLDDVDPARVQHLAISEAIHSAEQRCIASVQPTVAGGIHGILSRKWANFAGTMTETPRLIPEP